MQLLQDLLITGVTNIIPTLYQKVARRKNVDSAIRGIYQRDPIVSQAIADYEAVISSTYAGLTTELEAFLRHLEASGLCLALAEQALLKRANEYNWHTFHALHTSVFGAEAGEPEALYEQLNRAFGASLSSMIKDPALVILVRATLASLEKRLEHIDDKLSRGSALRSAPPKYDDIKPTLTKLARSLVNMFKYVRVETNRGAKSTSLDKIFISSKLQAREESIPPTAALSTELIATNSQHNFESALFSDEQRQGNLTLQFSDFQHSFRRAVVLGDPDGGKSTLCQFLCFRAAKDFANSLTLDNAPIHGVQKIRNRLPLRVVLRSFENARNKDPQLGLYEYIVRDISSLYPHGSFDDVKDAIYYTLAFGHALVAFDGLDEIMNPAVRREFVDLVSEFTDAFPLCSYFVTSRIVGYEDAPLPSDYESFTLERFDRNEVKIYVTNFLKVFSKATKEHAEIEAQRFIDQTERHARDLRQNPLLLGLMTFLFATKRDVPTNRPEIYQECATLMFERWDQNRDIRASIPEDFDILQLFGFIAANIYGNSELEDGVDRKWIEKVTSQFLSTQYEDRSKVTQASKKVASFITGRSWVMSEFGTGRFRFSHRTFMEYFYARSL